MQVQKEVQHLLKQVALLSKEIWVYCESGPTLHPQPCTLNPQPENLRPEP